MIFNFASSWADIFLPLFLLNNKVFLTAEVLVFPYEGDSWHSLEIVCICNYSGQYFPAFRPFTDQKDFQYGHILHSVRFPLHIFYRKKNRIYQTEGVSAMKEKVTKNTFFCAIYKTLEPKTLLSEMCFSWEDRIFLEYSSGKNRISLSFQYRKT